MNLKDVFYKKHKGFSAGYIVLMDPDKLSEAEAQESAEKCSEAGVDIIFVGGSSAQKDKFYKIVCIIKENSSIPVILFPGSFEQIIPCVDGVLYMSLISGRNPQFLIEEQVKGVKYIREYNLPIIPMAYVLIGSDKPSAVEKMTHTKPLERNDIESAVEHSIAGQYMGNQLVYLEGGSGVNLSIPNETIQEVKKNISVPLIVGGGIKTPDDALAKVFAGADFIVTGNVLENGNNDLIEDFVKAVHQKV